MIPHLPHDGLLVLNADDARCTSLAGRFGGDVRTFGYAQTADVRIEDARPAGAGWRFRLGRQPFALEDAPRFQVVNAAAAFCAAQWLGVAPQAAAEALRTCARPAMRYERRVAGGVLVVTDAYNSNPGAMCVAVESFLQEKVDGRRFVVCGDMLELGKQAPRFHRETGAALAQTGLDILVAVGSLGRHVIEGWETHAQPGQSALLGRSADDVAPRLAALLRPGDAVLIKGSRGMRLERVTAHIVAARTGAKEAA
jgi:UDP-N-acetylmuramyl pentapeptide synthase